MHVLTPKRFEGLEEDEITGYSNGQCCFVLFCVGLEEDKITWFSNAQKYTGNNEFGLEEGKITWYSNEQECLSPQMAV